MDDNDEALQEVLREVLGLEDHNGAGLSLKPSHASYQPAQNIIFTGAKFPCA